MTETNRHSVKSVTEKYWHGLEADQQVFLDWYSVRGQDEPTLNHKILNMFLDYLVFLPMYIAMDLPRARRFERAIRQWCQTNLGDQPNGTFWDGEHWDRAWRGTWYNHKQPESTTVAQAMKVTKTGVVDHDMLNKACHLLLEKGSTLCHCGTTVKTQRDPNVIVDAYLLISRLALRSGCEFAKMQKGDYDEDARILMLRSHKPGNAERARTKLSINRQFIVVESSLAHEILVRRQAMKKEGVLLFKCSEASVEDLNTIMHRVAKKLEWNTDLNWVLHALRHGTAQESAKDVDWSNDPLLKEKLTTCHMAPCTYKTVYGVPVEDRLRAAKIRDQAGLTAPVRGKKRNRS